MCQNIEKKHKVPADDQEQRPKHIGAITKYKNTVKQLRIKYCIYHIVARKIYNIKRFISPLLGRLIKI